LINVIERASPLCESDRITIDDLPPAFHKGDAGTGIPPSVMNLDRTCWTGKTAPAVKAEVMAQVSKMYCEMVLSQTEWRINKAATIAGIHARSLSI
jgi:DNA-binding NtrC family response regulator